MRFALPLALAIAFTAGSAHATSMTAKSMGHHKSMHHGHHHRHMHGPHHSCHGMGSGTAHRSCGTRSGGPVGGLH